MMDQEINGFLVICVLIFWNLKMHTHFQYLKNLGKINSANYLQYLFNPFESGYYYMIILLPLVFFEKINSKNRRVLFFTVLIWLFFLLAIIV